MPKKRILIVDDSPEFRAMYRQLLERSGFEVVECEDPVQALEILDQTFRAILTDNDMPKMSGLEFMKQVRIRGIWVPVAMVSGSIDQALPDKVTALQGRFFEKLEVREAVKFLEVA